jgi:hopene-associated glycosyltransferase HpnB
MMAPFWLGVGLLASAGWVYLAFFHHRFWKADQTLPAAQGTPARWPAVAVIVPARNEADVIDLALASLARQDYPGSFKIIVVNDNSSDGTAGAAKAVRGPITVLDAKPLAEGWAGKLAALDQGAALARKKIPKAEYLWFTDADILHGPGVLRALVEAAVQDRRDLVSEMVRLHCESAIEKAFVPAFVFFFALLYPFPAVNNPSSRVAGAAGGSILISKKALDSIGGLSAIKGALIDDCALARRVKDESHRIWLGFGTESESLRPYAFADFWAMVSRSAFTQLRHSYALLMGAVLGLGIIFLAPPLLTLLGIVNIDAGLLTAGLFSWGAMVVLFSPTLALYGLSPIPALALPAVAALYLAMTVDSAFRHAFGRGGAWKGRAYDFSKKH